MTEHSYRERLLSLRSNLNILQQRQAKYGLDVPVSLLNQIRDHERAIVLVEQAIRGEISDTELAEALAPLNLGLGGTVQNIFQTIQALPKPVAAGALLIGMGIIVLLFLISPQGQIFAPPPTATPLVITPAAPGENLIIVAEFSSPPDKPVKAGQRIHRELDIAINKEELDVRLEPFPQIENISGAREAGRVYSPTFIIWGWTDETGIVPNFTIPDSDLFNPVVEQKPLLDLEEFQLYVNYELPAQMKFFTEFTMGQLYFREQNYLEAERVFELALKDQPGGIPPDALANVYFYRAFTAHNLNNVPEAIEGYGRALELDSSLYQAHFNRGVAYQNTGQWQPALDDFSAAIELDPDLVNAYINQGDLHRSQGRLDEALADFDRALALAPDDVAVLNNRCVVHQYLGNFDQALADANRAIELSTEGTALNISAYLNRAWIYLMREDYELALADYQTAAEAVRPGDPLYLIAQSGLAWTHYLLDDYAAAIEINRAVLEDERYRDISPEQPDFYQILPMQYNLALALVADGQTAVAETAYDTALQMGHDPYSLESAINDLQNLLDEHPDTPGAPEILQKLQNQ